MFLCVLLCVWEEEGRSVPRKEGREKKVHVCSSFLP